MIHHFHPNDLPLLSNDLTIIEATAQIQSFEVSKLCDFIKEELLKPTTFVVFLFFIFVPL